VRQEQCVSLGEVSGVMLRRGWFPAGLWAGLSLVLANEHIHGSNNPELHKK